MLLENDRGSLLVVSGSAFGLAPGGICIVDDMEFARFRVELTGSGRVSMAGWMPAALDRVDLTLHPLPVHRRAAHLMREVLHPAAASGSAMDSTPMRARALGIIRAAHDGDHARLTAELLRTVGAGPGSTPAGDDIIVGLLAGLAVGARSAEFVAVALGVAPLLQRTTASSRHYLSAAIEGRFAERVHALVGGLVSPEATSAALRAARNWGATSGFDLAAGILAVITPTSHKRVA